MHLKIVLHMGVALHLSCIVKRKQNRMKIRYQRLLLYCVYIYIYFCQS